jgi:hypothetical protein
VSKLPESASAKLTQLFIKPASGKLVTSEHRIVIAQICADAKEAGLSVENLIVSLKRVFDQMPHSADGLPARNELRERLIAVCIEEYYRDGEQAGV